MNALRNMLNEFYDNIPEHFRQPVHDAINAAEENEEDHIVSPLHQLIVDLNRGQSNAAINTYMENQSTRGSATRRFFFPHTLPGLLHSEDSHVYPPPPISALTLRPAMAIDTPFLDPERDPFEILRPSTTVSSTSTLFEPLRPSRAISTTDIQGQGAYDALFHAVPSLTQDLRMNAGILSRQESAAMVAQALDEALNALRQPIVLPLVLSSAL